MAHAIPPTLDPTLLAELTGRVRGQVITPGDDRYEAARPVYNAMIDRRPEVIVRAVDVADVRAVLDVARASSLDLAVRGGGHHGAGLGTSEGIVLDLSLMRSVHVDPTARLANVGGGAILGDIDHAGGTFGLAVPSGFISTTGIGGITLGGGIGHLTRRFGLTIDSLVDADVVLADGSVVTADEEHEPDLFWAIRGGGGNFGVVIRFGFRMHPVGSVVAGPMLWPIERTGEVLRWYREFLPAAPRELNGFFAFLTVPPADPFPPELRLQKMCGVAWCYSGAPEAADDVLAPARALQPALDAVAPMPLPMWNTAFDALYPPGDQWYWRADYIDSIPDEAVAVHEEWGRRLPTWKSTMHLYPIDGAPQDVPADATPFAYRDSTWAGVIAGVDPEPSNAMALREWCVGYWQAQHPYTAGGAYINMMMDEGQERVRASYGPHYERLTRIKAAYDPGNLFHVNQNIAPAVPGAIPGQRTPVVAPAAVR